MMIVDIKLDGNDSISIPDTLYDPFCGTCFIDGIALPSTSDFSSAVLVGGLETAAPLKAQSSTWVDPVNPILYVSGYLDEHNNPAVVMPYRVTIIQQG